MNPFQAILLGVIQGLTEFFPVSSSGHLVIFQHAFGIKEPEVLFDVCVHVGTLIATLVYFYKDIFNILNVCLRWVVRKDDRNFVSVFSEDPNFKLAVLIIVGTIPTGLIGVALNHVVERLFSSLLLVGCALLTTAGLLFATRSVRKKISTGSDISVFQAVFVGFMQGVAIIPGISRSGSTIATGLFLGIDRKTAARYSFLLSIPAIFGALILSIHSATGGLVLPLHILIIGAATSGLTGYFALSALIRIVKKGQLYYFAPYCMLLGVIAIIMGV